MTLKIPHPCQIASSIFHNTCVRKFLHISEKQLARLPRSLYSSTHGSEIEHATAAQASNNLPIIRSLTMNNPSHAFLSQQTSVAASQTYAGDYIVTFADGITILQELDEITLDMNVEA
jgi:hypothetical protein